MLRPYASQIDLQNQDQADTISITSSLGDYLSSSSSPLSDCSDCSYSPPLATHTALDADASESFLVGEGTDADRWLRDAASLKVRRSEMIDSSLRSSLRMEVSARLVGAARTRPLSSSLHYSLRSLPNRF